MILLNKKPFNFTNFRQNVPFYFSTKAAFECFNKVPLFTDNSEKTTVKEETAVNWCLTLVFEMDDVSKSSCHQFFAEHCVRELAKYKTILEEKMAENSKRKLKVTMTEEDEKKFSDRNLDIETTFSFWVLAHFWLG